MEDCGDKFLRVVAGDHVGAIFCTASATGEPLRFRPGGHSRGSLDIPLQRDICLPPGQMTRVPLGIRARLYAVVGNDAKALQRILGGDAVLSEDSNAALGQIISRARDWSYILVPRSSFAKTPLILVNSIGIIDNDYQGELQCALRNLSDAPYTMTAGTAYFQICNLAFRTISAFDLSPGSSLEKQVFKDPTQRGCNGFGSSGAAGGSRPSACAAGGPAAGDLAAGDPAAGDLAASALADALAGDLADGFAAGDLAAGDLAAGDLAAGDLAAGIYTKGSEDFAEEVFAEEDLADGEQAV